MIEAYAGLSDALRRSHQLVIVSKLSIGDRQYLESLASGNGLQQGELVLTGYVPEDELISSIAYVSCSSLLHYMKVLGCRFWKQCRAVRR